MSPDAASPEVSHLALTSSRERDAHDPLRGMRDQFVLPPEVIYLDGNSLGALPRSAAARVADVVHREWGNDLIRSWTSNAWIEMPQRVGGKIATLIGAQAHEVIVADSTSVNLYKLIVAALQAQTGRSVVLSEPGNFPTDLYMVESALRTMNAGHTLQLVAREALTAAITDDTALVLLTHVHYKTAEVYDMAAVTAAAQARGAMVLWDLSHSVGALPLDLNAAHADLAVGCGYKFLNGGPGAPAFLFVAERHHHRLSSPLGGWMGHAQPFAFVDSYEPAPGVNRFLCGTPSVLGVAALEAGVDVHLQVDMSLVAQKSRELAELLIDGVAEQCAGLGVELVGPPRGAPRGSHVSFRHAHAYAVVQALIANGVIGDFRDPDIMRFGLTPLYLRYRDIERAVEILAEVLRSEAWRDPRYQVRAAVT